MQRKGASHASHPTASTAVPPRNALHRAARGDHRRCCSGKACSTYLDRKVEAVLDSESPTGASVTYTYDRGNDITFFAASTVDGLIEQLNDPAYWPVIVDEE